MTLRKNKSAAYEVKQVAPRCPETVRRREQRHERRMLGPARDDLCAARIPCSAYENSLFRTEQGILCNTLISHREKGTSSQD
jgi:hypothetical protein